MVRFEIKQRVLGIPHHRLRLKIGSSVMLLRNIDTKNGLCNGTRLIITHLGRNVIGGIILTGSFQGQRATLPRVAVTSEPSRDIAFRLKRLQFPVRLSFAITINKAQGQSLNYVGIDLRSEIFGHGQLYVALSRATKAENVRVVLDQSAYGQRRITANVVYQEVLQ
jgi:ATP-dependent DNA helicase PIF1